MKKKQTTPDEKAEETYLGIVEDTPECVTIGKRKVKVRALRYGATDKLSHLIVKDKEEASLTAKCAAVIILNRLWKLRLFYWILWRWFFYVKEYNESDYSDVLETAKKKLEPQLTAYYRNIILLTAMRETKMAMTKQEVNRFRQERLGEAEHT